MKTMMMRVVALAALASATGCGATTRFVTTKTWFGNDTVFVAYTEAKTGLIGGTYEAKVMSCKRQPDNSLKCEEQPEVNKFLNVENSYK